MSKIKELDAEMRDRVGKGSARAVRREGRVPAVIYGGKSEPESITLEKRNLQKELSTGKFLNTLYNVKSGKNVTRVIPRDVQMHPVSDAPIHVDFLRLLEGARVNLFIPIRLENEVESPGLKRGGVLNIVRYEVELDVPADNIPDEIVGDLTGLDINDSLHISAFQMPEGCSPTITDRDFTVVTVAAPSGMAIEEEAEEGEEAEVEETAAVEEAE